MPAVVGSRMSHPCQERKVCRRFYVPWALHTPCMKTDAGISCNHQLHHNYYYCYYHYHFYQYHTTLS